MKKPPEAKTEETKNYLAIRPGFGGSQEGAGRPHANIDWDEVSELCKMQCTQSEIAGFFHIDIKTLITACKCELKKDFSVFYKENAEGGKCSLRRAQWRSACLTENPTMLIWGGKQYLGQTDKIEQTIDQTSTYLTQDERAKLKHEKRLADLGPVDTDETNDSEQP